MNLEERANKAVELKTNGGLNCCQAVVTVLADEVEMNIEDLNKIASGFAIGIGNMEATCGALIGAVMIASLKIGKGSIKYTRQISESFKEKCGAITCNVLKGFSNEKIFCPCEICVKNAVLAYGEVMGL